MLYRSDWHSVLVSLADHFWDGTDNVKGVAKKEKERVRKESLLEKARRLLPENNAEQPAEPLALEPPQTTAAENIKPAEVDLFETPSEVVPAAIEVQEEKSEPVLQMPTANNAAEKTVEAAPSPMDLPPPTIVEAGEKADKVHSSNYVLPLLSQLGKGSEISGEKLEVVDIPTGYTHNIENLGDTDMVTFMWCNECFDPSRPDTFFLEV